MQNMVGSNNNLSMNSNNITNYLQNTNPLAIFSSGLGSEFLGHKTRNENAFDNQSNYNNYSNMNYGHLSPNFSAGSIKALSPYYKSVNPTPNINTSGAGAFQNYFMFNNPTGTPIKAAPNNNSNNVHSINFQMFGNNNNNNNIIINSNPLNYNFGGDDNSRHKAPFHENLNQHPSSYENHHNVYNHQLNNNSNHNPEINITSGHITKNLHINVPKINIKDEASLAALPTPGRNLGFYSWVIHGSPVLHNNPNHGGNSFNPLSAMSNSDEMREPSLGSHKKAKKKKKNVKKNLS